VAVARVVVRVVVVLEEVPSRDVVGVPVRVVVDAVPAPVKYGRASAAEISPAIAASSAS
jgi:hypothetical protein